MKTKHLIIPFDYGDCGMREDRNLLSAEPHTHAFDEIAIVLGGTSVHVVGKDQYPLMRGDVFVIHSNQEHGNKKLSNFHILNIVYKREFFDVVRKELEDFPGFRTLFIHEPCFRKFHKFKAKLHLNPHQLSYIKDIIDQMIEERDSKRPGFKVIIEYLFRVLIVNLCRCYTEIDTPHSKELLKISSVIDFMEQNFDKQISLSELANRAFTSKSTFSRAFKRITNCTPIDYLIKLRIEKAADMMVEDIKISVINSAMKSGFDNSSYFTRKFKAVIGMTPMEYLKKQRETK